jgi:outer membrane murein-binding lipoprotein Lpp
MDELLPFLTGDNPMGNGQLIQFWTDHESQLLFYGAVAIGTVATILAGSSFVTNASTFITSIMNARMFHKAEKNDEAIKKSLKKIDTKLETLPTKENLDTTIETLGTKGDLDAKIKKPATDLDAKIETLATKEDLDAKIKTLATDLDAKIETLATKEDLDAKIETLATKEGLDAKIKTLATKGDLDAKIEALATTIETLSSSVKELTEVLERKPQSETKRTSVFSEKQI